MVDLWPLVFFILAGLIFLIVGWFLYSKKNRNYLPCFSFVIADLIFLLIVSSVAIVTIDVRLIPMTEKDLQVGAIYNVLWQKADGKDDKGDKVIHALLEWWELGGKRSRRALFNLHREPPECFIYSRGGVLLRI